MIKGLFCYKDYFIRLKCNVKRGRSEFKHKHVKQAGKLFFAVFGLWPFAFSLPTEHWTNIAGM